MENEPQTDEGERSESLLETVIDRMRGTGVGTEDPNIVGDVGPTDVPPGRDPDPGRPDPGWPDPGWPPREADDRPAGVEEDPETPG